MVSQRRLTAGFLSVLLVLCVAFYLLPAQRLPIWIAIGVAGAAAVAVGAIRNRPRRRSAWWLIMAALLVLTLGEATHFLEARTVDRGVFPTVADVIYLAGFVPLLIVGGWRLVRSGAQGPDRTGLLDTLIVATAAAVLSWVFLISALVLGNTYTVFEKAVAVGYPVSGVLVLAVIVRLAAAVRWTPAMVGLLLGVLGMLGSGAAYGVVQLQTGWRVGGFVVLGWVALFVAWGAAALHPSMADLTTPRAARRPELTRGKLVALAAAALVAPVALLADAPRVVLTDTTVDLVVRRLLIVSLFVFVLLRLYTAVDSQLRGSARERALRGAGTALVEATTASQVVAAVRTAVAQLLPRGATYEVVVEIGGTVLADDPGARPGLTGAAEHAPAAVAPARSIHTLDPPPADDAGVPGAVLRCQLSLPHPVDGHRHLGALYVAADKALLVELEASVEVVASQAALALERIRLTEEINRRASEEYFRTLVHNAADVILIVNDDNTVRYASPSAATVLGVEQPGRLHDLMPPEGRHLIDRTLQHLRDNPQVSVTADWNLLAADGRRLQAEAVCRDLRADPTVAGVVITLRDVTEQRRLQQELTRLAFHDPLTGLANRALLRERLERAVVGSARDQTVTGMLCLDVDDLKAVNDTFGHPVGDEMLVATARRLAGALRQQDTAARLGGDEFAALIVGARAPQEIEQVAQRVVAAFAEPFSLAGHLVSRAVSVGVATTSDARDGEELLRQADLALYVAKRAGKAQWHRYSATPHPALARPPRAGGPVAQPELAMVPGAALPAGAAISRMLSHFRRGGGDLRPADLVAGPGGLIVPVGAWILESALADAALRSYPVTVADRPHLRIDVSAGQPHLPGSVASVHGAPEATQATQAASTFPAGLVQVAEGLLTLDQQLWVDVAGLHMIVTSAIDPDTARRGRHLLVPHRGDRI